jgi:hypothetical protein
MLRDLKELRRWELENKTETYHTSFPAKSPADIVADFLCHLRAHIKDKFRSTYGWLFEHIQKEIVITIPDVSIPVP